MSEHERLAAEVETMVARFGELLADRTPYHAIEAEKLIDEIDVTLKRLEAGGCADAS